MDEIDQFMSTRNYFRTYAEKQSSYSNNDININLFYENTKNEIDIHFNWNDLEENIKYINDNNLSNIVPDNLIDAWTIIFPVTSKLILDEIDSYKNNKKKLDNMIKFNMNNWLLRADAYFNGFPGKVLGAILHPEKDDHREIFYNIWYKQIEIPRLEKERLERINKRIFVVLLTKAKFNDNIQSKKEVLQSNGDLNRLIASYL
jgi:hypothetical protein